jgi:hypothetical protein
LRYTNVLLQTANADRCQPFDGKLKTANCQQSLNRKLKTGNPFRDICPTCSGKISPFCYNEVTMMCRICQYNQRQDVDRALLSGVSLATLSRRCSFPVPELVHQRARTGTAAGRSGKLPKNKRKITEKLARNMRDTCGK